MIVSVHQKSPVLRVGTSKLLQARKHDIKGPSYVSSLGPSVNV